MKEYIHQTGEEVRAIGGGYELQSEDILELDGKKILYVLGYGVFDTSCCGVGGCRYALVPGLLHEYKASTTPDGHFVSQVQPVIDEELRGKISKQLLAKEAIQQVQFW